MVFHDQVESILPSENRAKRDKVRHLKVKIKQACFKFMKKSFKKQANPNLPRVPERMTNHGLNIFRVIFVNAESKEKL